MGVGGHIKIDRRILEWEWYSDINTCRVFIHLLLKANWKDGRFQGTEVPRGSLVTSYSSLEFTEGRWSLTDFVSDNSGVIDEMYNHAEFMNLWGECEVIGNVFDNPELLEV